VRLTILGLGLAIAPIVSFAGVSADAFGIAIPKISSLSGLERIACGSRGGPGVRGANGRCLSWREVGGSRYGRHLAPEKHPPTPAAIVVPTPWKAQILPERPRETWGLVKPSMHGGSRPTTSTKLSVLGRTLEIYRGDPPIIVVGDQVVLRSEGFGSVSVQGIYEADARAYVLVQENTGGRLCPATYRILEIAVGPPRTSEPFGTCSDLAIVRMTSGAIQVHLPRMDGSGTETYTYRDGRVTSSPQPR
jgi:hypothetical protein